MGNNAGKETGQIAYEEYVRRCPLLPTGEPRPKWGDLLPWVKWSWTKNVTTDKKEIKPSEQ